jgi:hypothetical protein
MTSPEPVLFPCPRCGTSRGEGGVACKQCGWDPNVVSTPTKPKAEPYSKLAATIIGFLTLLPVAYIFFFFAVMLIFVAGSGGPNEGSFMFLFVMHFAVIILTWCLIGFYIYYLFKTDHVKQDQKALWAVLLFLGNMLAMPVFWYLYIWKPAENAL